MSTALHTYYITALYVCVLIFKILKEIAMIKAVTIKNKDRMKDFHDASLSSPSDPVIARWTTWLRTASYYIENLPVVCAIVNKWASANLLVSSAKEAINVEDLVPDLVKINQYRILAAYVEFLEGSARTITEAYGLLKNLLFDDDPCAVKITLKNDYPILLIQKQ